MCSLFSSHRGCKRLSDICLRIRCYTRCVNKDCYDNSEFDMGDVVRISKGTTKQDELFDYVDAPYYLKERVKDYDEDEYYKDDFDMSR